jgi:sulfopyruvate decarboxylase subunit alpha
VIAVSAFLSVLEAHGVTDVVGLPDNSSAALFARLEGGGSIRLRTVTREGEAFALAAGLWMGGAHPLVLVQNTGLLESGDSIRGTVVRMRIPIVSIVTYRGYGKMEKTLGAERPLADVALLSRTDLDSVALVTEPTLRAWGLPFATIRGPEELPLLHAAFTEAEDQRMPVVRLLACDLAADAA